MLSHFALFQSWLKFLWGHTSTIRLSAPICSRESSRDRDGILTQMQFLHPRCSVKGNFCMLLCPPNVHWTKPNIPGTIVFLCIIMLSPSGAPRSLWSTHPGRKITLTAFCNIVMLSSTLRIGFHPYSFRYFAAAIRNVRQQELCILHATPVKWLFSYSRAGIVLS
jgi:hypothetical protein